MLFWKHYLCGILWLPFTLGYIVFCCCVVVVVVLALHYHKYTLLTYSSQHGGKRRKGMDKGALTPVLSLPSVRVGERQTRGKDLPRDPACAKTPDSKSKIWSKKHLLAHKLGKNRCWSRNDIIGPVL